MFNTPSQFAALQQAAINSLVKVANIQLESTKALFDLQVTATRDFVEESVKSAKSLTSVKDVQEALSLQSGAARPGAAKAVAYTKSVYEVFAKANAEIKEIAEAHAAEVNKQVVSVIDTATQSAPAGTEPAVAFVKSAVSAATNAIDQFAKVSKQAADTAQANVAAAFAAIEKPVVAHA